MRRWVSWAALLVLTVSPALLVGWRAWAGPRRAAAGEAQRKVLAAIPRDATVLINVTAADMPASPDVLALGKRSTRALERCLANNPDESLRGYCADLIGVLGDRSALPTLHVALEDWDRAVRRHVIEALAKIPDARSLEPLLQAFARKDEDGDNRGAILTALGPLGDRRAVKVLRRELEARPAAEDLRQLAFRALWRSRHVLPRATLVDVVAGAIASDNGALAYEAVLRAAELRARPCVKPLLALIEHPDENVRNKSIYALGLIGDRRAIPPLLALLPRVRDARRLNNIAFALERIDRPAFHAQIGRMIQHQQAVIRLNATFVLGDVRSGEGVPLIEVALRDPSDRVRLEAIEALAKVPASPRVAAALGRALADADAAVRVEALEALARIPPGATNPALPKVLERALTDPDPEVQRHAIDRLGELGTEASLPALAPFVARRDSPLREPAIYATYALSHGKRADLVYDLFVNGGGDGGSVRRAAIVLGRAGDLRVRPYLLACLESRSCAPAEVEDFLRKDRDPATSGRLLLAWAGPRDGELTDLVGKLRPSGVVPLAEAKLDVALARGDWVAVRRGIDLVVALQDDQGQPRLAAAMAAPDLWMQLDAAVALVRLGHGAAEQRLLTDLDNLPAEWLPALARLIAGIEEAAPRARLMPELARREAAADYPVALAAAAVRLAWAPDAAFSRFLRALRSDRVLERELAERYLWHRPAGVDVLLRRALAVEKDEHVKDELLKLLEVHGQVRG